MKSIRLKARWRWLRRRMLDIPSILIAGSGLMLWFLLPHNLSSLSSIPSLPEPRVLFIPQAESRQQLLSSPTIFALPSIYGFGAVDVEPGMPDVTDSWYGSSPHYLARDVVGDDERIIKLISITGKDKEMPINHRITVDNKPVFTAAVHESRKINIVYHGNLQEYGFDLPELDKNLFDKDKSWIIRLMVQVNEEGYPEQIFIEKGSNIPGVDAKIIRLINQGRLKQPGKRCAGRVTVNFGL